MIISIFVDKKQDLLIKSKISELMERMTTRFTMLATASSSGYSSATSRSDLYWRSSRGRSWTSGKNSVRC